MARDVTGQSSIPVELIGGTAEAIPIENASIDTVVTTWTMCGIANIDQALEEVLRVLKPGGPVRGTRPRP